MRDIDYTLYLAMSPAELRKLQWKKGWALSVIGLIAYGALRLFGQRQKDYEGICPYFEIGNNWGGASIGWFFICCNNCSDYTKQHEVGHCIQNAAVGGLTIIGYSIGSVVRYWWRRIFKIKTPYDGWFFEADATRIGAEYVQRIKKEGKE